MSVITPFQHAAAELHAAADIATARATGNPLDPWSSLAGTLRLVAGGIDPMPPSHPVAPRDMDDHLVSALDALDQMPDQDAPGDHAFWRAHIADVAANVRDLESNSVIPAKGEAQ